MNSNNLTSESSNQLAESFVPEILKIQFLKNPGRNDNDPLQEDHAALLWIDICNFSPLCNRLMKEPLSGVEKITGILEQHFQFVTDSIIAFGGQPLFFVGDGLMSVWPGDKKTANESVPLAAACSHHIINNRTTVDDHGELISIHHAIALGKWQMVELEGLHGSKLVSFFGEAFNDLLEVIKNRAADQLLIRNSALAFLDKTLSRKPSEHETSVLLDSPKGIRKIENDKLLLTEEALQKLISFVPPNLSFPLNRDRLKWIAEIRPVNIIFVKLPNESNDASINLQLLKETVKIATPLIQKYEGILNQVWIEGKETNMLICLGPPPSVHFDNPERSTRLAFELHRQLKQSGLENSIGISSGMAYCGILGNDHLRQYTVIGDVVNLSARIAGMKTKSVYCDQATYLKTQKAIKYKEPISATLRGRNEASSLYEPESIIEIQHIKSSLDISVGRKNELAQIMDSYKGALEGKNACLILEGESGMGKSQLLEDFKNQTLSGNEIILSSSGDFIARNSPFNVWGHIFLNLFGLDSIETGNRQKKSIVKIAEKYGSHACLLNIVLQTDFPESDEIKNLTGAEKVAATHDFLLNLLDEASQKHTLVLIIDDAQWMDETSWNLLKSVNAQLRNCLILLSIQNSESINSKILLLKNTKRVTLKALEDADLEILISAKIGVNKISVELFNLIKEVTKANPYFCLELAGSLIDQQLLILENNEGSLVKDVVINKLSLPETVKGVVRMRIDRLEQGSQLSLKVGSVVGNKFSNKIVSSIYPIEAERKSVPSFLNEAKQSNFLDHSIVDNLDGYLFNNATTAEVAYEMTLAEQRRQLHRASAEWYEENFKESLHPFYVRLAHHWEQAGEIIKSSEYLEMESGKLVSAGYTKQAIEVGIKGINLFDINIDPDPSVVGPRIGETLGSIAGLMGNKSIQSLLEHKNLDDPRIERLIVMLTHIGPYTYIGGRLDLFVLLSVLGLKITLENGNAEATADVYSMYSIVHRGMTGDSRAAFDWSRLAIDIDNKHGSKLHSRVAHVHAWFMNHWVLPLSETFVVSRGGIDAGLANGDVMFTCFNLSGYVVFMAAAGYTLDEVIETGRQHLAINNMRVINAAFHLILEMQMAKALKGTTTGLTLLTDDEFDETKDLASILKTDFINQHGYYYIAKLKLHTHVGEWEEALKWAEFIPAIYPAIAHQISEIEFEMFQTIALLYRALETNEALSSELRLKADTGIEKIKGWAEVCSSNFLHKAMMLEGIREGLFGNSEKAKALFEQAAVLAGENGYINDRALVLEQLLRMQDRLGLEKTALNETISAWQQLGAEGKAKYISERFA